MLHLVDGKGLPQSHIRLLTRNLNLPIGGRSRREDDQDLLNLSVSWNQFQSVLQTPLRADNGRLGMTARLEAAAPRAHLQRAVAVMALESVVEIGPR